jgi:hypothetical protein
MLVELGCDWGILRFELTNVHLSTIFVYYLHSMISGARYCGVPQNVLVRLVPTDCLPNRVHRCMYAFKSSVTTTTDFWKYQHSLVPAIHKG